MTLERKDFVTRFFITDDDDATTDDRRLNTPIAMREHKAIMGAFDRADKTTITVKSIPC